MAGAHGILTSATLFRDLVNPGNKEEAWRTFVERYQPLILGWCHRWGMNRDDRDDVCSAVLTTLVESLSGYDRTRRFRPWLKTVVHNQARQFWRRLARRPGDRATGDPDVHSWLQTLPCPDSEAELIHEVGRTLEESLRQSRLVAAQVRRMVRPETWSAFWQTAMEGRPAPAVARELGLSVQAVYQAKYRVELRLKRAGKTLRDADTPRPGGATE